MIPTTKANFRRSSFSIKTSTFPGQGGIPAEFSLGNTESQHLLWKSNSSSPSTHSTCNIFPKPPPSPSTARPKAGNKGILKRGFHSWAQDAQIPQKRNAKKKKIEDFGAPGMCILLVTRNTERQNKTTNSRLSRACRDVTGVGETSLCKHKTSPSTKSGLIHQPGFDKTLRKPFLRVEETSCAARGGGSRLGPGGTQKPTTRGTGHCQAFGCNGEVFPSFLQKRSAGSQLSTPPGRAARTGGFRRATRVSENYPDETAPRAPGSSWGPQPRPRGEDRTSVEAARRGHSPPRVRAATRPGAERCSPRAASVLGLGPPRPPLGLSPPGPGCPSARLHSLRRHLVSPLSPRPGAALERPPPGAGRTPLRQGRQLPSAPLSAPAARTHHTKSPSRRLTAAILPPNHRRRTGGREHQLAPAPPIG